jgi:hypothetical protein
LPVCLGSRVAGPATVSRQIQIIVQEPISLTWNVLPKTADEWRTLVAAGAAQAVGRLPAIRDRLRVKSKPTVCIWEVGSQMGLAHWDEDRNIMGALSNRGWAQ